MNDSTVTLRTSDHTASVGIKTNGSLIRRHPPIRHHLHQPMDKNNRFYHSFHDYSNRSPKNLMDTSSSDHHLLDPKKRKNDIESVLSLLDNLLVSLEGKISSSSSSSSTSSSSSETVRRNSLNINQSNGDDEKMLKTNGGKVIKNDFKRLRMKFKPLDRDTSLTQYENNKLRSSKIQVALNQSNSCHHQRFLQDRRRNYHSPYEGKESLGNGTSSSSSSSADQTNSSSRISGNGLGNKFNQPLQMPFAGRNDKCEQEVPNEARIDQIEHDGECGGDQDDEDREEASSQNDVHDYEVSADDQPSSSPGRMIMNGTLGSTLQSSPSDEMENQQHDYRSGNLDHPSVENEDENQRLHRRHEFRDLKQQHPPAPHHLRRRLKIIEERRQEVNPSSVEMFLDLRSAPVTEIIDCTDERSSDEYLVTTDTLSKGNHNHQRIRSSWIPMTVCKI